MLLCSAQPRKDSLLSPRAPKGASLAPKGLCLAAAQPVLPEGGVSKVTCRVLCHGRGPQPWHSRVIAACSELLSLGKTRPQPMAHTPPWGTSHIFSGAQQNHGVTQAFSRDESISVLYRARLASSTKNHNLTRGEEKITYFGKQKHTLITEIQ